MKISVGHVLLLAGVGTYVVLGPLHGADKATIFMAQARNIAADKLPYMDFLRTTKPKVKKAEVSAPVDVPASVADKIPAAEAPALDKTFSEVPLTPVPPMSAPVEVAPVVPVEPVPEATKAEVAKPVGRRRHHALAKPVAAASVETPVKAASSRKNADKLVGTYVSMTLKTGNSVKGMLLEHTATNYKIELPGLGAFDYAAATVKSISAAE